MFLVKHWSAPDHVDLVFLVLDPHQEAGFSGDVLEDVTLDKNGVDNWGGPPLPVTGYHPDRPAHYRCFRSNRELVNAGFIRAVDVPSRCVADYPSWSEYKQHAASPARR